MVEYNTREDLIQEILKRSDLFINEFNNISEDDKNKIIAGVDRTPAIISGIILVVYMKVFMNNTVNIA